ncbi:MAG: hypothetical protein ACI8VE_001705 [Natrialbaceae archaeon]|jgi:hypothetical protein
MGAPGSSHWGTSVLPSLTAETGDVDDLVTALTDAADELDLTVRVVPEGLQTCGVTTLLSPNSDVYASDFAGVESVIVGFAHDVTDP